MAEPQIPLRTTLCAALVDLLKGVNDDVGDKVDTDRDPQDKPLGDEDLPHADVYFGAPADRNDGGPIDSGDGELPPDQVLREKPLIHLRLTTKRASGARAQLDLIHSQFRVAIARNNLLADEDGVPRCVRIRPVGVPMPAFSQEGDREVACYIVPYELEMLSAFDDPYRPA